MSKNKSVQKRIRQAETARERNRHYKTMLKTVIKKVKTSTSQETAEPALREAFSVIDKVAGKGIIHKNNAANRKSKLAAHVNRLS
jgi:small subunit ribosomal protein S20